MKSQEALFMFDPVFNVFFWTVQALNFSIIRYILSLESFKWPDNDRC